MTSAHYVQKQSGPRMGRAERALANHLLSSQAWIPIYLGDLRETDANGNVGNIAANGGILASDTTPVLSASSKSWILTWATGNADVVAVQIELPPDFDGTGDAKLDLEVASGTTNAASFNLQTAWDGGAAVSDDADDAATKSATVHKVQITIDKSDIPDSARRVTLLLTPPAHATDTIILAGLRLNYKRKLLTS